MTSEAGLAPQGTGESNSLAAARAGDGEAFAALTRPLQREIHVHCYRMLGSFADADDALQETLVNAWRSIGRFEPRASIRAWLYRIATNVCLTMLARRKRRAEVPSSVLAGDSGDGMPLVLDPYPDALVDALSATTTDPLAISVQRESVELAFVAAVQFLPSRQRAALLLGEVMGFPTAEIAAMLGTTLTGANSVLQRARATLERERTLGRVSREHVAGDPSAERLLIRRLVDAWHMADVAAIVALLTDDAIVSMPPQPTRVVGRDAIAAFLLTGPGGGHLDRFRLVPTRVNNQPAVGAYLRNGETGPFPAHGVFVIATHGGRIASLVRFDTPWVMPLLGLPTRMRDGPPDLVAEGSGR